MYYCFISSWRTPPPPLTLLMLLLLTCILRLNSIYIMRIFIAVDNYYRSCSYASFNTYKYSSQWTCSTRNTHTNILAYQAEATPTSWTSCTRPVVSGQSFPRPDWIRPDPQWIRPVSLWWTLSARLTTQSFNLQGISTAGRWRNMEHTDAGEGRGARDAGRVGELGSQVPWGMQTHVGSWWEVSIWMRMRIQILTSNQIRMWRKLGAKMQDWRKIKQLFDAIHPQENLRWLKFTFRK